MPAGVSSQFLSALAMVAPRMADGLTVEWKDKPVSAPYLNMTLALLRRLGCTVELHDQGFSISGPVNNVLDVPVEPDWSSGGMVYALAAVAPKAEVTLVGLSEQSLQGDAACAPLFERLGLHTQFTRQGAVLTKKQGFSMQPHMEVDFLDCPDLAQPFAMAAGLLGVGARLTGLQTLQGKETRRLDALVNELSALGIHAEAGHDVLILHPGSAKQPLEVRPTYGDHRMAMAMAAAGLRFPLSLENPRVVGKSFPGFWEALHNLGFQLTR